MGLKVLGDYAKAKILILSNQWEQAEILKRSNGFVSEELYLELDQDRVDVNLGYEGGNK